MRLVFMGSPDFAVPALEALHTAGHEILAVFSQPDKPRGRGREMLPTPVKKKALELEIPVYTPASVRNPEVLAQLKELNPQLIIVVAYGKILPAELLQLPPLGCINVHASLLPGYRGAAPIHRAIVNGDKETGVTTMHMDVGLDTGDMIYKQAIPIAETDTLGTVHDSLANVGAKLLLKTLVALEEGTAPREKQNSDLASYAPLLTKDDEKIQWQNTAEQVVNQVRGMNPFPGTFSIFRNQILKIRRVQQVTFTHQSPPGTIVMADAKKGVIVACGEGAVSLLEVQPSSGKHMDGAAFVRGYKLAEGEILENERLLEA